MHCTQLLSGVASRGERQQAHRQQSVKALAHSPHRPRRVSSSLMESLYRGKRTAVPQAPQRYSSTRPAPCAASSGEGAPMPALVVLPAPQAGQRGELTQAKNWVLNQASSSWARAAWAGGHRQAGWHAPNQTRRCRE